MGIRSLLFSNSSSDNESLIRERAPIRGLLCARDNAFKEKVTGKHVYLERGSGPPIIFCHGMYGSIYSISKIGVSLSKQYRFIAPYLPLYDLPLNDCSIPKLADYLESFVRDLGIKEAVYIGSSMGGGTLLHCALRDQIVICGLVLCGSSGLSTMPMQKGFFKRRDYSFVKKTAQEIYYDPTIPPDDMIREIYVAIQKYEVVLRTIRLTKSTARDQMHDQLPQIKVPTLLIWGKQDIVTPPETALLFEKLLPNSVLHYIDQCGHVPTQEHPEVTLNLITDFLRKIHYT